MNYQWRDLVGSLVDGKYPLVEYLGDVAGNGVFATNPVNSRQAIIRLMPGGSEQANLMLEQWRAATALKHPHIAGTYAPPAVQEPITTATCGMPAADKRAWL